MGRVSHSEQHCVKLLFFSLFSLLLVLGVSSDQLGPIYCSCKNLKNFFVGQKFLSTSAWTCCFRQFCDKNVSFGTQRINCMQVKKLLCHLEMIGLLENDQSNILMTEM